MKSAWLAIALSLIPILASAADDPALIFREDWKVAPPNTGVSQADLANSTLVLTCHGPGASKLRRSHHDKPADDPYYIWSGYAEGNWAVSLRHRALLLDLSGAARIRWRAKQSGFRLLHVIVRLGNGNWLVGDQADGGVEEWKIREFDLAQIQWRRLDITNVTEGKPEPHPDLSRVEEIGFTDLMTGGGTPASSRLDWIEVYGRGIPRS